MCVEVLDRCDDGLLFVFSELGVNRQRQDFGSGAFGLREIACPVAQRAQRVLLVEAERVVDLRPDRVGGEEGAELVAARGADDVLVEDGLRLGVGPREDDAVGNGGGRGVHAGVGHVGETGGEEELVIAGGEQAALLIPLRQIAELDAEDGGLQRVEP